jgi:hypothetical protein
MGSRDVPWLDRIERATGSTGNKPRRAAGKPWLLLSRHKFEAPSAPSGMRSHAAIRRAVDRLRAFRQRFTGFGP